MRAAINFAMLVMLCTLAGCGESAPDASVSHQSAMQVAAQGQPADNSSSSIAGDPAQNGASEDPPSAATADIHGGNAGDEMLAPLTADDIQLYLSVMRAAAARVQHPSPDDLAALQQFKSHEAAENAATKANAANQAAQDAIDAKFQPKLEAAMKAAESSGSGSALMAVVAEQNKEKSAYPLREVPALDDAVFDRAQNFTSGHADLQIVSERHLDQTRYGHVSDEIQAIIDPFPQGPGTDGRCDDCGPTTAAGWARYHKQQAYAKKVGAMMAHNRKTLAPYAAEIGSLQLAVRKVKQ